MNEYYGNYCHPEPHDCKPEPCAPKLPYSPVPPFKDTPDCGYCIPPMPPCKPYVAGVSPEEQMSILTGKVNQMIDLFNKYQCDTYGAYEAIVNSALCNGAYYNEVTTEEGYIAEASSPYKVIHIPFLDKAKQPIYLELGLAYNNTTNANVHEDVFSASQRTLADKLIPAYQSTNTWIGAVVWKGAPISNIGENPADYTVGVTDNGFIKVYEHLTNYAQLKQDHIRNAMQANSVLVMGGKMTPDKFYPDEKDQLLGRVGIGMNYDTKERFIVIVQGSDQAGCTTEMLANIFLKYNCTVAVEVANGMKTTALDKGQFVFTPPTTAGDEVPTIPEVNAFWYITKRRHYKNEYVKDVAELTQKYGQELWRTVSANISVDNIKELVAQFTKMLEQEIADREEGDNKLRAALDAEIAAREEGDTTLNERITTEVQTINTRIDNEVATLNKLISDTKTELQNNIDTLNTKVEQYHTELDNADIASVDILQDGTKDTYRLKRKDGTYVDIPMEVYNYELLVQKLDTLANLEPRLEQEITERKAADTTLQENIDKVASDATQAENELREQLNEETQARIEADNAEKVARQEADTALGQRIDELQLNVGAGYVKKAGDTMTGPLTLPADPTENLQAATKQYVDSVTKAGLGAEAAEREKQDNLLNEAIAQEATTRAEADTALNGRVEAVEQAMTAFDNKVVTVGDTTLVGEGVKAITDGKIVLWVREGKDPVVFTAYDADEVSFSGYTTEQPAFVKHTFTDTGVAFNTGTETFLNNVVGEPSDINQAVSKGYVDEAIQNLETNVGTDYVKVDGTNAMTGDLNMGGNHITNVEAPVNDGDAVNKQYFDSELSDTITELQNQFEQAQNTKVLNMQNTVQDVVDAVKDYVVFIESGNDADRKYMQVYGVNSADETNYNINAIQFNNGVATFYTYTGVATTTIENCTLGDTINATVEDDKLKLYLGVAGTVPINITNVSDPVDDYDAANKKYVDEHTAVNNFTISHTTTFSQIVNALNQSTSNKPVTFILRQSVPQLSLGYMYTPVTVFLDETDDPSYVTLRILCPSGDVYSATGTLNGGSDEPDPEFGDFTRTSSTVVMATPTSTFGFVYDAFNYVNDVKPVIICREEDNGKHYYLVNRCYIADSNPEEPEEPEEPDPDPDVNTIVIEYMGSNGEESANAEYAFSYSISGASTATLGSVTTASAIGGRIVGVSDPVNASDAANYDTAILPNFYQRAGKTPNILVIDDATTVEDLSLIVSKNIGGTLYALKNLTVELSYTGAIPSYGSGIVIRTAFDDGASPDRKVISLQGIAVDDDTDDVYYFKYEHENPQPTDLVKDYITVQRIVFANSITGIQLEADITLSQLRQRMVAEHSGLPRTIYNNTDNPIQFAGLTQGFIGTLVEMSQTPVENPTSYTFKAQLYDYNNNAAYVYLTGGPDALISSANVKLFNFN